MLITAIPLTIINNYLGLSVLTYPQILFCYLSVMVFNERHKIKILFLLALGLQLIVAFLILPVLYQQLTNGNQLYYYLFPLFMFLLRNMVQMIYWIVGYSTGLFLQIPLFIIGLEYGTILSVSIS